jgi:hypothetical protein
MTTQTTEDKDEVSTDSFKRINVKTKNEFRQRNEVK